MLCEFLWDACMFTSAYRPSDDNVSDVIASASWILLETKNVKTIYQASLCFGLPDFYKFETIHVIYVDSFFITCGS